MSPKSPFFKKEITYKDNDKIKKLLMRQDVEQDIFHSMQVPKPKAKDGKRLYLDRVNISDTRNMHSVEQDNSKYYQSLN